jgi:hypothetical protein
MQRESSSRNERVSLFARQHRGSLLTRAELAIREQFAGGMFGAHAGRGDDYRSFDAYISSEAQIGRDCVIHPTFISKVLQSSVNHAKFNRIARVNSRLGNRVM